MIFIKPFENSIFYMKNKKIKLKNTKYNLRLIPR